MYFSLTTDDQRGVVTMFYVNKDMYGLLYLKDNDLN